MEYMPSRTSNILPTVDNVKNYQSRIVVLDTSQPVAVSLPFLLSKILHYSVHHSMCSIFTYKFIYVFVLQFYDLYLVVQFMYIKTPLDQQIEQVSTFRISSLRNRLRLILQTVSPSPLTADSADFKQSLTVYRPTS